MQIPLAVKKAIIENNQQQKISRLVKQFRISSRSILYPRKKDLRVWMFSANLNLTDQVWDNFMTSA